MEPRTPGAESSGHGLDIPLFEVTFAVVDTETTGGSPDADALTEIAAVAVRGGEVLGTFQTLVQAVRPIEPFVTELTGITDDMVRAAPPVSAVLPSFLEFVSGAVLVGHNIAFDIGFLDAALAGTGRPPLDNPVVDTLLLARRLVRDVVPDCALGTLAKGLRLEHKPSHRALADALATADLLHRLIEAATGFGVLRLIDLLEVPDRLAPMAKDGGLLAAS
ncbi:MAG: exonuclease domain-containing protein [Acidimicrobiales bacterium]